MGVTDGFQGIEMRVGRIVDVQGFPEARKPSYRLTIDFGPLGTKRSAAQLCSNYKKEELLNTLIIGVVNLEPRQIGPFVSEVLVLGVPDGRGECILLRPDKEVELGAKVY